MSLTIRQRLYVLSIVPLLIISLSMMYLSFSETQKLNNEQITETRSSMMDMKRAELKSYLQIAETALSPLTQRNASLEEAMLVLREISFGSSGYLFGYNSKGDRLLLGKSDKGVGENFWSLQDSHGNYLVQDLLKNAKKDAFTTYYFPKPGESTPLPKLSYSVYLSQWDLMIGTGFYTDDVDALMDEMAARSSEQLDKSLLTIVTVSLFIVAIVGVFAVILNRSIMRPLELFDASIRSFASGDADLTARMEKFNAPEFAKLSDNFNAFVTSLQDIIKRVNQVGQQVVDETDNMTKRATQVDTIAARSAPRD